MNYIAIGMPCMDKKSDNNKESFDSIFGDLFGDYYNFEKFARECNSRIRDVCIFVGSHGKMCNMQNCLLYKKDE